MEIGCRRWEEGVGSPSLGSGREGGGGKIKVKSTGNERSKRSCNVLGKDAECW